jgi:Flp pilus assembly protein TadB
LLFFSLVVVVGPLPFSFFFQQVWRKLVFWILVVFEVAGWLWLIPQAVEQKPFDLQV